MIASGIKATELIAKLQFLIKRYGDKQVFLNGGDYPEGASGCSYREKDKGDGYVPGDSFELF